MSNPTISKGRTWANGETVTPTRLNNTVDDATIQVGATRKMLARVSSGAGECELVDFTAAGEDMMAASTAHAQLLLMATSAGADLVEAADVAAQQALLGIAPIQGRVTSGFTKSSDTTLANVTGLSLTLVTGQAYSIEGLLRIDQDTTGLAKYALSGTATMTSVAVDFLPQSMSSSIAITGVRITALNSSTGTISGQASLAIIVRGIVVVNAGGTLTIQFAQNSANGSSTVLAGSYLRAIKF